MTAYATSAQYATYSGSANTTATATATIDAGAVDALTITDGGGYGYLTSPDVVIEAPDEGVRATATATVANGVVSALTLLDGGSGYAEAPAVTIAPGDSYVIDCRYGHKTVTDAAGANKLADLTTDSDLATFHLAAGRESPGGINVISITADSISNATRVHMLYHPRYVGI